MHAFPVPRPGRTLLLPWPRLLTPLPSGAGAAPLLGTTLQIAADGTLAGTTDLLIPAATPYGLTLTGTPFVLQSIGAALLIVDDAASPIAVSSPAPDGSTTAGYSVTLVIPGIYAAGYHTYTIVLVPAVGQPSTILSARFLVHPA